MISLTLPSKKHKDLMHEKICNQFRISENEIKIFYEEIKKRYSNYYYTYNKWVENPQNSILLGSVITETIVNQNSDFSIQKRLPYTDAIVNMEMFKYFADNFKSSRCQLVFDLNYGRRNNIWQALAKRNNSSFLDGQSALAYQARRTFLLWTGREVPQEEFLRALS